MNTADMPQEKLTTFVEPTLLSWLAVAVAVVTAGGVIWNAILTRKTARQQATLGFLEEYKNDKRIFEALQFVYTGEEHNSLNPSDYPNVESTYAILNKYEILATGLKHKIYDEKMVIETLAMEAIKVYEYYEPLIAQTRKRDRDRALEKQGNKPDQRAYIAFELMAKKYKARFALK